MTKNRTVLIRDITWDTGFDMDASDRVAANKLPSSARLESADFFHGEIAKGVDPLVLQNNTGDLDDDFIVFCGLAMDFLSGETGFAIENCVVCVTP